VNSQPNVLLITTDQQRADLSAREGFALDTTPFLDALAREGVWFDRAYTTVPTCAPARISMLTGRYPSATRARTNHNVADATFQKDLFDVFRDHGYRTALCGKNHSHVRREDVDFYFEASHLGADDDGSSEANQAFHDFLLATHFHMAREATPYPLAAQLPSRIVAKAEGWLDRNMEDAEEGAPFFLWLSFPEPHNPYQAPEPYYSLFPPEAVPENVADESALDVKGFKFRWCRDAFERAFPGFQEDLPRARSNYLGMLRLLDDQVRRIVDFLEARGLRDDTLIVFLSDHGDFVGEYGLLRKGPELPEALVRIPFSVTGPGVQATPEPLRAHVSLADLFPTLCEAVGAPIPDGVQGRSLWPLLSRQEHPPGEFASAYAESGFGGLHYTGGEPLEPTEDGFEPSPDGETWGAYDCLNSRTQSGQMRMVRKDDWKLIFDMTGRGQLYNLREDRAELRNLFGCPEVAVKQQELVQDLLTWMLRVQDPLPLPRRRYVLKRDERNYWS
jgi:arylsulfatase A-like enzyme